MVIGKLIRYGIPVSFAYCTIYVQDLWREGDDDLIANQKRMWSDFDKTINSFMKRIDTKLDTRMLLPVASPNGLKDCWNSKVRGVFDVVDLVVTNPKYAACRLHQKLQPYISSSPPKNHNVDSVKTGS